MQEKMDVVQKLVASVCMMNTASRAEADWRKTQRGLCTSEASEL